MTGLRRTGLVAVVAAAAMVPAVACAATTPAASRGPSTTPSPVPSSAPSTVPAPAPPSPTAPATIGSTRPLAGVVVVLDPGHNGGRNPAVLNRRVYAGNGVWKACNTTGTATRGGYPEHTQVFDVARRTADLLRREGATVVLTRSTDAGLGPCITERAAIGNRAHASVVVSIHDDGNDARGARGFHVIRSPRMAGGTTVERSSARLSVAVRDGFAAATHEPRSTYLGHGTALSVRSDLGGLNLSRQPAVLVECGNMRNATDAALLASPVFRQREAAGLVSGVRAYLTR